MSFNSPATYFGQKRPSKDKRTRGSGGTDVVVAGGRGGGSRPEREVVIRTMYDEPPSAAPAATCDAGPV